MLPRIEHELPRLDLLRNEIGNAAVVAELPPMQEHQELLVAMLAKISRDAFRREFFAR
jgi:hypothetical protein